MSGGSEVLGWAGFNMARGKRTDPHIASQIAAMAESGYETQTIAEITNTPQSTVFQISHRQGIWASINNDAWFKQFIDDHKRTIAVGNAVVNEAYLERMVETASTVSGGTAIMGYGVTVDKGLLFAGEPTEIHEHFSREICEDTDKLAERLRGRLMAAKVIDVEPEGRE